MLLYNQYDIVIIEVLVTLYEMFEYAREQLPLDEFPERDEEIIRIMEELFHCRKYEIFLNNNIVPLEQDVVNFKKFIQERKSKRPLAYILGYSYFYNQKFPVSEQTLIPRYDTEHVVETVRKNAQHVSSILDICTGTGVIALCLHQLFHDKKILGLDIVEEPFQNSKDFLKISDPNISFKKMDFLNRSLWSELGFWDCIVSNPPYLDDFDMDVLDPHVKDHEPSTALYAGTDGMIFYEAIAEFAESYLNPNGIIVLEIDHKYQYVSALFSEQIFSYRELIYDYNDLPRVLLLKKTSL